MENNISNSDKTDEVHIEEYDKTDAIQSDEYGFEDETPEDVDIETKVDDENLKMSSGLKNPDGKKSITSIIGKQLPALANILNRVKKKKTEKPEKIDKKPESIEGEKTKPKFKLTPIHIVVIIGLVVFLFIGDDEPEVANTPRPEIPKRKVEPAVETENSNDMIDESLETEVAVDEVIPTENDNMADIRMENTPELNQVDETIDTMPEISDIQENIVDTPSDPAMNDLNLDIDKDPKVMDEVVEAPAPNPVEPVIEEDIADISMEDVVPSTPEEIVPQEIVDPELSSDITKKLLENLQVKLKEERVEQKLVEQIRPIGAPSYESAGRGLVYNCSGGHWACIDSGEYQKCRQNYSWNKSESIPMECYPMALLENDFDCGTVQQEKVNSVPDLSFCK